MMAEPITMTIPYFIAYNVGLVCFVILLVLQILYGLFTPVGVFFRAWLGGKPVLFGRDRTGQGRFMLGSKIESGLVNMKDGGVVEITENSQTIVNPGKVTLFNFFQEHGATIPLEFEASVTEVLQRLQEHNIKYKIKDYRDWKLLCDLAHSETYEFIIGELEKERNNTKNISVSNLFFNTKKKLNNRVELYKRIREVLVGVKIPVRYYKTYRMEEYGQIFPHNRHPHLLSAYVTVQVNKALANVLKFLKTPAGIFMGLAMFVFIAGMVTIILVKILGGGGGAPVASSMNVTLGSLTT